MENEKLFDLSNENIIEALECLVAELRDCEEQVYDNMDDLLEDVKLSIVGDA